MDNSLLDKSKKQGIPTPQENKNNLVKNFILYGFLALAAFVVLMAFGSLGESVEEKSITEVLSYIRKGSVQEVVVSGDDLRVTLDDGKKVRAVKEPDQSFISLLTEQGLSVDDIAESIKVEEPTDISWVDIVINFLPLVLMVVFFVMLFKRAGGNGGPGGGLLSFGKSKAQRFGKEQPQVSFDDAAGLDTAKKELREVVDFLKNPGKYRKLGARIPKGVLLVGPAGTGKTLLARAVASEANVPFFSVAGSEFMEMLVGVGSARVRDLFKTAKQNAPSLVFIDEIETIGRHRGASMMSQGEQEQTLNQILTEMDGFEPNAGVVVIGATNRPQLLDPALVRPGRFDRRIVLNLPDIEGREGIIKIHMKGKPFTDDVDVERLARRTAGFSGADIENMLNEAAILAAREGKKKIGKEELEEAATKVKLGPAKKRLQTEEERRLTAFHEAGHAVVSYSLPNTDPVHRVSIVSRGLALGFTMIPPTVDRYNQTQTRLEEQIVALLGGRAAESMALGEFSIGASSDIQEATKIARKMVTEYGMSSLGPISLVSYDRGGSDDNFSWRGGLSEKIEYSEEMEKKIDREVKKIIDQSFERARKELENRQDVLERVAEKLMEQETIGGDEFRKLMEGDLSEE
ncbi:MAG: ATP-dependent zinc metalloprotease FtsH [Patescibacteria group bacterium]